MEDKMNQYKKIRTIKKVTTIMDTIGMVFTIIAMVIGIVLFALLGGALSYMTDWFQSNEFSELTGGYEALGGVFGLVGSLFGVVAAFLIIAVAALILIMFLVPSVHGLVLGSRTDRYLAEGGDRYPRAARRDSIIKIIFNGIPAVLLLKDVIDTASTSGMGLFIYLAFICGLEIYALRLLGRRE